MRQGVGKGPSAQPGSQVGVPVGVAGSPRVRVGTLPVGLGVWESLASSRPCGWTALCLSSWPLSLLTLTLGREWPSVRQTGREEDSHNVVLSGLGVLFSSAFLFCSKVICSEPHSRNRDFHRGANTDREPPLPPFWRLSDVRPSWKSLMNDYGLRAWISMRCGFPTTWNVFIILCNDSLDNSSLSSEGISIKMEESIKMLYARIYKLGNFLDYCNHLQNWLFQCGIDRFQQLSLTTSTFSDIYSYWSLNPVCSFPFLPAPPPPVVLGHKVRQTSKNLKTAKFQLPSEETYLGCEGGCTLIWSV